MIKIWFEDIDWTDSSGNVVKMGTPNYLYLNTRLLHNYSQPIITEDSWNGQTFPVQIDIWEGYQLHIALREMSLEHLAKLQSCKTIFIEDTNTNEIVQIDTQTNGGFTIEQFGRQGTANQSFMLTFKSNRIISYPGLVRNNTHHLVIEYESVTYNFYTDYSIINFVSDAENSNYTNDGGINYTAKSINKEGKRMLFYLLESDAVNLKRYSELAYPADVAINTTIEPVEKLKCTLTALTEGLYKCEIEIITTSNIVYA